LTSRGKGFTQLKWKGGKMKKLICVFIVCLLFHSSVNAENYWVRGVITEYHVKRDAVIIEINNTDDPKCTAYNWYGDYIIEPVDPSENITGSMMSAHKMQVLFDHYKNNRSIALYVGTRELNEEKFYCPIHTITVDQ
jgi:hypothetical protein